MLPGHPETPKLALVMVGLPARGKTYIAQKVARYLSWLGYRTRVFNVGNYRRARLGSHQQHEFFNPDNPVGSEARMSLAMEAMDDMIAWLKSQGEVAIYDATNSTRARRKLVRERCEAAGLKVQFIETICDDDAVIDANVRETKLRSPDYANVDPDEAVADFRARIAHYERSYETVGEGEASYIKLIDVGRQVVASGIDGYLPARLVFFLMNLHVNTRPIWLTRHGESLFNVRGLIGGDPELSPNGEAYARGLKELLDHRFPEGSNLSVWTSTARRTVQTASLLERASTAWRSLDEIDAGVCDGLSYAEIREKLPEEFAARAKDKFHYRYPRGESYQDVIERLDPVIIELERTRVPVLVIGHQAVLRALYAYFLDLPPERCPYVAIPLHTVIQLTPQAYGCEERRVLLPLS